MLLIRCRFKVESSKKKVFVLPSDITVKNAVSLIFCEYKVNTFFAKGKKYRFWMLCMELLSIFRYIRHAVHLLDIR